MTKTKVRFWRPAWASKFHGLRLRRMREVLKSQVCFSFLGVPIRSFVFVLFFLFCFAEKTMFSSQTLLKGSFSLLTCHLQFSITARVSVTLKRQSVQSLSDHKAARTFFVSQERGKVERMVCSKTKWTFPLIWSRGGGGGWGGGG